MKPDTIRFRISYWRRQFPEKFPVRRDNAHWRDKIARASAERRKQKELARHAWEVRQQQRRAERLRVINQLDQRWRAGVAVSQLAREYGAKPMDIYKRIWRLRKKYPGKFPKRPPGFPAGRRRS